VWLLAGLRRAEVFALHWTDDRARLRRWVGFDADVIRVRQTVFFRHGRHWNLKEGEPAYVFQPPKSRQSGARRPAPGEAKVGLAPGPVVGFC
jgi:hypothetical protein